ncbi:hypothetical protein PTT_16989 [Pyrenophora teres f. teres 0-1]|uniref:Cytochrome P450 n=1 Tax=Pyrenophora teres f. teres (strain 0-1) TaxID=861557 RepID=E3S3E8_PYRTT|nr:hypothetical protein PTT_16989 [Pyrenophora teres f. teres 0-1]
MSVIQALATLCSLLFFREACKWLRMIIDARSVGLPMVFVPIDQTNFFWILFSSRNRFRLQRLLTSRLWKLLSRTIPGWELFEPSDPIEKPLTYRANTINSSFMLIGPRSYEFWTADPQVSHEILRRIHDFEQPRELEFLLAKFGPNVLTSNGDQWARHRKIVAKVINERISKAVFEKSIYYSREILHDILPISHNKDGSIETAMLFDKLTQVSFSILISVGIGDKFPWYDEEKQEPEPPYQMAYKDALFTYVNNAFGLAILPAPLLNRWPSWAPGHKKMKRVGRSMIEFCMRNQSLINQEQNRIARGETSASSADFIALLVQASQGEDESSQKLSEKEMISDLFAFTAGGFKTIAGALDFAVVLLARFPLWQDWLIEEVDSLIPADGDRPEHLEYTNIYPQAVRTLAFVMETERLIEPTRLENETFQDAQKRLDAKLRNVQWAGIVTLENDPHLKFKVSQRR